MKKILFILSCLIITTAGWGQSSETNQNSELYKNAPDWAKRMYSPNPNANEIDQLYSKYYRSNKYVKSYHTQYYKRWRKAIFK
jgi:hypothetical protein